VSHAIIMDTNADYARAYERLESGAYAVLMTDSRKYYAEVCELQELGFDIKDCAICFQPHNQHYFVLLRKPYKGTYAECALKNGVGGLNIDESRVGDFTNTQPSGMSRGNDYRHGDEKYPTKETVNVKKGRWPTNLNLQHSDNCEQVNHNYSGTTRFANASQSSLSKSHIAGSKNRTPEENDAVMRQAQKESIERMREKGRWPTNLNFQHGEACECVGTKTVKGDGHDPKKSKANPFGGDNDSPRTERHWNKEVVGDWICEDSCPIRRLDVQSGDRPSTRIGNPKNAIKKEGNLLFGGVKQKVKSKSHDYRDKGGASRFFRHYANLEEAIAYYARLIAPPAEITILTNWENGKYRAAIANAGFRVRTI